MLSYLPTAELTLSLPGIPLGIANSQFTLYALSRKFHERIACVHRFNFEFL